MLSCAKPVDRALTWTPCRLAALHVIVFAVSLSSCSWAVGPLGHGREHADTNGRPLGHFHLAKIPRRAWTSCRSVSRSKGCSQLLASAQALRAALYLRQSPVQTAVMTLTWPMARGPKPSVSVPMRKARDDVGLELEGQQIPEEKQRSLPLVAFDNFSTRSEARNVNSADGHTDGMVDRQTDGCESSRACLSHVQLQGVPSRTNTSCSHIWNKSKKIEKVLSKSCRILELVEPHS